MIRTESYTQQLTPHEIGQLQNLQERISYSHDGSHDTLVLPMQAEMNVIDRIQNEFDQVLGVSTATANRIRSYNPVLSCWRFENCKTSEEQEQFRIYENYQIDKNLRERYQADTSMVRYIVDNNGKMRNELFPDEPFENVLQRGIMYRFKNGSKELTRELYEAIGYRKVQEDLTRSTTPLGKKRVVISGPGLVANTAYTDNFVDVYEKRIDGIYMTRFKSGMSYEEYLPVAAQLDPTFEIEEDEKKKEPLDAKLLKNPFSILSDLEYKTAEDIFEKFFMRSKNALSEVKMQLILKECEPFKQYYTGMVMKKIRDPLGIAIAFNAILRIGDITKQKLEQAERLGIPYRSETVIYRNVALEVRRLGLEKIDDVDAGCGLSGGIDVLANSVGQFGADRYGERTFACPDCKKTNIRPINELLPACQHCKSRNIACDTNIDEFKKENKKTSKQTIEKEKIAA